MTDYQLFIDGVFCDASDGNRFDCINPANGQRWASAGPAHRVAENAHHLGSIDTTDSGKLAAKTRAQSAYVADYYMKRENSVRYVADSLGMRKLLKAAAIECPILYGLR